MQTLILLAVLGAPAGKVPSPTDAVSWALTHQNSIAAADREFQRYVWIPSYLVCEQYDERHIGGIINWVVNATVARASVIVPGKKIANGWMLAYDIRQLDPKNPARLAAFWDELALDEPYFHETRENAGGEIAAIANHIEAPLGEALVGSNVSSAMVFRSDWLIYQLIGAKYYESKGWVKSDGSLLSQAEVYSEFSIDEDAVKKVNGDQRVAIAVSGVTASVRRVDRIQGIVGRFNSGAVWQTFDTKQDDGAIAKNPLYNLLSFVPDGGEAIIEQPNGLHAFVIYNAQRQLVRFADPELVTDYTVPAGNPCRLQPGISCIRCHGASKGLHPAPNHVRTLVESGTDILGQVDTPPDDLSKVVDRLAGLYLGDFDKWIRRGREDYEEAIRRCTRHPELQAGISAETSAEILASIYGKYAYKKVDAGSATFELGFSPGADAKVSFDSVVPLQELRNPTVASLRAGIEVRRSSWEQVYSAARTIALKGKTNVKDRSHLGGSAAAGDTGISGGLPVIPAGSNALRKRTNRR